MSIVDDKPRLELKFHLTAKTPLEGPPGLPVMRQVSFDPSTPLDGEEVAAAVPLAPAALAPAAAAKAITSLKKSILKTAKKP